MKTLWQDLRYGGRSLRKNPGFTFVAVLTLALGIGANTAVFSVVYGVLLRPLPYPHPERVVDVRQVFASGRSGNFSDPNFEDVRDRSQAFSALAEYWIEDVPVSGGENPVRVESATVSSGFFAAVGVAPAVGRPFTSEERREGGPSVVIVGNEFWRRALSGDRDLARRTIRVGERICTVVGVMPGGFAFPGNAEIWIPREQFPRTPSRTAHNFKVVGRLRDGVSMAQARGDVENIATILKKQYGDDTWMVNVAVVPLRESLVGSTRPALIVLLGAVGCLLLVACANVTSLLFARAAVRQKDFAVRVAMGATSARLALQFVSETLILASAGGFLGVLIAVVAVRALPVIVADRLPRLGEIAVSLPVLAFAMAVAVLTSIGLGLITALRTVRRDPYAVLRENGPAHTGSRGHQRTRRAIVAFEVAVTLLLLTGVGLFARSFAKLVSRDPGFRSDGVLTISTTGAETDDPSAGLRRVAVIDRLLKRLAAIPGIDAAGMVDALPMTPGNANGTFLLLGAGEKLSDFRDFEKLAHNPARTGSAEYRVASEGYFAALHIPLRRGRLFTESDDAAAPHAALITESLAKTRWPDSDSIGARIEFGNMDGDVRALNVVGIIGDIRQSGLDNPPTPTIFTCFRQRPQRTVGFDAVVHASGQRLGSIASAARAAVRDVAPDVPFELRTLDSVVSDSLAGRRFPLVLLSMFGLLALLLATLGISGVVGYTVARRRSEFGVRMALGASAGDVVKLVLAESARLVGAGLVAGLVASVLLTRLVASQLVDVPPSDPLSLAGAAALLGLVALAACYVPARRALQIAPLEALREN